MTGSFRLSHGARMRRAHLAAALLCAAGAVPAGAQPGPPPSAAPPMAREELVRRLRTMTDGLARRDQFSGVILLAQRGAPVFEQAYGFADREAKRRVTIGTAFNLASVGKLFTQIAIGQLVAARTLSLDSTISAYWPDYPDRAAARKVTIRQLLAHRSGIDGNIFENPLTLRTNRDNVPAATRNPLAFEPGTRQQYSNAGYVVLGEIIERVSGEVYHEYIQRHVFTAAGMRASGFFAVDSLPPNAAHGYTRGLDLEGPAPSTLPPLTRNAAMLPRRGSAAGGSYANAHDLLRFVRARRDGSLGVPARGAREAAAGGSPGANTIVLEGLPGDYDMIVLANLDPPAASAIADSVEGWLSGGRMMGGAGPAPMGGPQLVMRGAEPAGGLPPAPAGPLQKALPETPQGRVAGAYLRAFSTGDPAVMRTFITANVAPNGRSMDDRLQQYRMLFSDLGPLTLVGVRAAPGGALALEVRSEKNGELTVIMAFTAEASDRIAGIQFRIER